MRNEITTIIFSKNRACQLELLLRTSGDTFANVHVLYSHDPAFQSGYQKVKETYPGISFIKQDNFRHDVIELMKTKYTMFLCDDDIMIRSFNFECEEIKEFQRSGDLIICFCLRLSRDYDYSCIKQKKVRVPHFIGPGLWDWYAYIGDWAYPFSVTSHIFQTEDILPTLEKYHFPNPHMLERVMKYLCPRKPFMINLEKAVFINNLANQVQNGFPNKHGEQSAEYLNDMFLKGYVIDAQDIIAKAGQSKSCFMMESYCFKEIQWQSKT